MQVWDMQIEYEPSPLAQSHIAYIQNCYQHSNILDHLFVSIVLSKITYDLSFYAVSSPELTTVQNFLRRCYKRKYISYAIDVNELIDKSDRSIFNKIKKNCNHPLYEIMPKIKQTSLRLRNPTSLLPRIHTERFKASYINRLYFKYKLFL